MNKLKYFLAGAFLTALAVGTITPLLGLGAAATAIDIAASLAGGVFAVTQA